MHALARPFWFFASVFVAFAVSWAVRKGGEGFLAGLVFSGFLAFRFREPIPIRRLFPVAMLLVFLLGIGHTPARTFTPTLSYTTECLLALRILLLVLVEVQVRRIRASMGVGVLCLGLLLEAGVSAALAVSAFRGLDPAVLPAWKHAHLWALVVALVGERILNRFFP